MNMKHVFWGVFAVLVLVFVAELVMLAFIMSNPVLYKTFETTITLVGIFIACIIFSPVLYIVLRKGMMFVSWFLRKTPDMLTKIKHGAIKFLKTCRSIWRSTKRFFYVFRAAPCMLALVILSAGVYGVYISSQPQEELEALESEALEAESVLRKFPIFQVVKYIPPNARGPWKIVSYRLPSYDYINGGFYSGLSSGWEYLDSKGCKTALECPEGVLPTVGLASLKDLDIERAKKDSPVVRHWIAKSQNQDGWGGDLLVAFERCQQRVQHPATKKWITIRKFLDVEFSAAGLSKDWFYNTIAESGCDPNASSGEADGLHQFTPETGKKYGLHSLADRRDIVKSTYAKVAYIKDLMSAFDNIECSIIAYNTGENRVGDGLLKTADLYGPVRHCLSLIASGDDFRLEGLGSDAAQAGNHLPKVIAVKIWDQANKA